MLRLLRQHLVLRVHDQLSSPIPVLSLFGLDSAGQEALVLLLAVDAHNLEIEKTPHESIPH